MLRKAKSVRGFVNRTSLAVVQQTASLLPKCGSCGLWERCDSPKMAPFGRGKRKVLIVGEAPGFSEAQQGKPFVGKAGQHLRQALDKLGIDMDRECWTTNALICHPKNAEGKSNRTPTPKEVEFCRPNLERTIREKQPDVILLLGSVPIGSFLVSRFPSPMSNGGMGRWTGWKIPCRSPNAWVIPTWHPSYLMRERNDVLQREWERHLKLAFDSEGKPWKEIPNERSQVRCIFDPDEAAKEIADFSPDVPIAFDYESNMLKPDSKEARIVCCSMSNGEKTIAYPWHGKVKEATGKFLQSRIPKVTYNAKFEVRWTLKEFGHGVRNVAWDGMLAAHAIDNRPGVTGCDFQAFVNLGMPDYWSRVGPYLKAKRKGGNEPNRIGEVDLESLLTYCALDSLVEFKIAQVQMKQMGVK